MVIPKPESTSRQQGFFVLDPETTFIWPGPSLAVAEALRDGFAQKCGLSLRIVDDFAQGSIRLRIHDSLTGKENYTAEVRKDGIVLCASDEAGLFYGAQTLIQLAAHERAIPCQLIHDGPRFQWRGFMLDSCRHFQSVERVKRHLDMMALFKLNILHWHLTEDEAWRIEIRRYPRLTEIGSQRNPDEPDASGFYTQDQLRDIVDYAAARHIQIVPEIEVPAHTTAAMVAYPELTCEGVPIPVKGIGLKTFTQHKGRCIYCAGRDESFEFIANVLDEVMDIFPSEVIHIGGDERPDGIWSKCPRCLRRMSENGLESESDLQHWFMERVNQHVLKRGRRSMAWTPTLEHGVPDRQIVHDWLHGHVAEAVRQGHQAVNSKDRYTYFDYPPYPGRQKPDWMPDLPVEKVYEFDPINDDVPDEKQHLVLGGECSLWTEFIEDDDFDEAVYPRMMVFAETVWSPKKGRDWADMEARLKAFEPWMNSLGIHYAKPVGERPVRTKQNAKVSTTMAPFGSYLPERAFDGKFVRSFWSQNPPKAGDSLTVLFQEPIEASHVRVYTGSENAPDDTLVSGSIEVSADGQTFRPFGKASGSFSKAKFNMTSIRAVRLTVDANQPSRLAIREIVVD